MHFAFVRVILRRISGALLPFRRRKKYDDRRRNKKSKSDFSLWTVTSRTDSLGSAFASIGALRLSYRRDLHYDRHDSICLKSCICIRKDAAERRLFSTYARLRLIFLQITMISCSTTFDNAATTIHIHSVRDRDTVPKILIKNGISVTAI